MKKIRTISIVLPLEEQYRENQGWEDSFLCHELDRECKKIDYFRKMNHEELILLIRKMDNFLMERGVGDCFCRNYALADQAFHEMD